MTVLAKTNKKPQPFTKPPKQTKIPPQQKPNPCIPSNCKYFHAKLSYFKSFFWTGLAKAFWGNFLVEKKKAERGYYQDLQNREGGNAELFTKFHRTKTRRLSLKLQGNMIKLDQRQYFFSQWAVNSWNLWPQQVAE